jgi:prevent-host-death family protein
LISTPQEGGGEVAIIGVRELVRTSKDILARVVDQNEPFVITRHGKPVAALVPVDPADAERYILAAAPEMIRTRDQIAAEGGAGETRSLDEAARELGVELPGNEPDEVREPAFAGYDYMKKMLGEQADDFERAVETRVQKIADEVVASGKISYGAGLNARARVRAQNNKLFWKLLADVAAAEKAAGAKTINVKVMSNDLLDRTTKCVYDVNSTIFATGNRVGGKFSLENYEQSVDLVNGLRIAPQKGYEYGD